MTNRLIILLFLISQLMLGASAKAEGTIKVALYPNPPQLFIDEKGKPQGLVADVLSHIASKEGWQIEYVPCETRKCLEQLESGQIDLMCPVAFKKERTNRYDFTNEILLANWAQIFARPGVKIKSILDLDGKRIAVIDGVVLTNNFRKMLKSFGVKSTFVAVPDFLDILRLIDQGEVDAGVLNRLSGILNKGKYNVEQTPIIFSPVEIRFAAPKGQHKDLLATIDKYLVELKADSGSIYYQSLDRYFGLEQKRVFPEWAKWILGLTVSLVFLFVGVSIFLRTQVRNRTVTLVNAVAERKWTEEALGKSEEKYRSMMEAMDDAVYICSSDFCIEYMNPAMINRVGRDATGETCHNVMYGLDKKCPWCIHEKVMGGEYVKYELVSPADDKTYHISNSPIFHIDRSVSKLTVFRDLTEMKKLETKRIKAEEALQRSEKQASAAIEAARGVTFSHDIATGRIEWGGALEEITGYSPEEFADIDIEGWTERIHPSERDEILSIMREAVHRDRTTAEYQFKTKHGDYITLSAIGLAERDEKGEVVRLVGILQDITEKKKLQAEAMRAGHLASLGELAAGVAHEINNPITGIIGYAEILKDEFNDRGEDDKIPTRIIKEGDRVAEIVKNLLAFAQDRKEEFSPAYIQDILADAFGLVERRILKDGVKLNVDVSPDLPKIKARSQEIQQVFLNIISNARYALNQRFPGSHEDKVFKIRGETLEIEGKQHIRIIFYDRGTGISEDILDRICDPFYSTKPKNEGTGLGLNISHGIIENHGGKLWVESVEGEYTKVMVDLPVD